MPSAPRARVLIENEHAILRIKHDHGADEKQEVAHEGDERGVLMAAAMPVFVISLKATRVGSFNRNTSEKCQAMASPSRSRSVASTTAGVWGR